MSKVVWPTALPDFAKVAVSFVLNVEEGAESSILNGDRHSEYLLSEVIGAVPKQGARALNVESCYEYGSRAGIRRVLREFTSRNIPLTIFACAASLEKIPSIVQALEEPLRIIRRWPRQHHFRRRSISPICETADEDNDDTSISEMDHLIELSSHGYRWVDYSELPSDVEAAHLDQVHRIHAERFPHVPPPAGIYQGKPSESSLSLSQSRFIYDNDCYSDDLPFFVPVCPDMDDNNTDTPQLRLLSPSIRAMFFHSHQLFDSHRTDESTNIVESRSFSSLELSSNSTTTSSNQQSDTLRDPLWLRIPYSLDTNDMRFLTTQGFSTSSEFAEYVLDAIKTLVEEARRDNVCKMMTIGLHCRIIGRPGRLQGLIRILETLETNNHLRERIWVCKREEIAFHYYNHYYPIKERPMLPHVMEWLKSPRFQNSNKHTTTTTSSAAAAANYNTHSNNTLHDITTFNSFLNLGTHLLAAVTATLFLLFINSSVSPILQQIWS